jgi:hypothetical protein
MPALPQSRLIALGASNLTRGAGWLIAAAQQQASAPVEVFAALGHGRSYGIATRLLGRGLPGIDGCGLWAALDRAPPLPATGLLMDVGNDLLYGVEVPTILGWVERALARLRPRVQRLAVAELPMHNLRRLGPKRYTLFRSLLFPRCRVPLPAMLQQAELLNRGLEQLAERHGAVSCQLRPEWYGIDPIHILRRCWPDFCRELLGMAGAAAPGAARLSQRLRLLLAAPAQRSWFGRERHALQPSLRWPDGATVSLW